MKSMVVRIYYHIIWCGNTGSASFGVQECK